LCSLCVDRSTDLSIEVFLSAKRVSLKGVLEARIEISSLRGF
jgi:hypothetical protein